MDHADKLRWSRSLGYEDDLMFRRPALTLWKTTYLVKRQAVSVPAVAPVIDLQLALVLRQLGALMLRENQAVGSGSVVALNHWNARGVALREKWLSKSSWST